MTYDVNFAVIDIETAGLNGAKHPMMEIAIVPFTKSLEDLPEYNTLIHVDPNLEVQPQALNIHGISIEEANKNGKPREVVAREVCDFLTSLKAGRNKPVIVGHNIDGFDLPFIKEFMSRYKIDFSKFYDYTIDTLVWARLTWIDMPDYKLGTCCAKIGHALVDGHRAVNDTRSNRELAKYFLQGMRREGQVATESTTRFRKTFQF